MRRFGATLRRSAVTLRTRVVTYRKAALNQFAILYADRFQPIAVGSTAPHTEI